MTTPAPATTASQPPAAAPAPGEAGSSGPRRPRRIVWWVVAAVVILAVLGGIVALLVSVAGTEAATKGTDDPGNYGEYGTRAAYTVIGRHGVDTRTVRGQDEFRDEGPIGADTTVVVGGPDQLSANPVATFTRHVAGARRVVLVDPDEQTLDALGLAVTTGSISTPIDAIRAGCSTPGVDPGDVIATGRHAYVPDGREAVRCFANDGTSSRPAGLVVLPRTTTRPEYVIAAGDFLLNKNLERHDDAGVAVRMLAASDRLLWYVPAAHQDTATTSPTKPPLWPAVTGPLIVLAFGLVAALSFWRGRRFGPLATEPLPAVVKAIETTESRGRMYHRAKADRRAAAVLRIHTLHRLSQYLGLPYDQGLALIDLDTGADSSGDEAGNTPDYPTLPAIIDAVAAATQRDPRRVADLLAGPLPTGGEALLNFTTDLTTLEKEVRRTP